MEKDKRLLMICPFARPNLGGVETHLDKLMSFLAKKRVFTYLLAYQPLTTRVRGKQVEKDKFWEIHRVSWFGYDWFNKLENYFPLVFLYLFSGLFLKSFRFYLKRHREIGCLHAHGLVAASIVKVLARVYPARTVISTHAIYDFKNRRLMTPIVSWLLGSFDKILAVSEVSRLELINIGLDKGKIDIHPNWIDLEKFSSPGRTACKKKLNLTGKMILFVGRMIEKKGAGFLLKAAKRFKEINFVFVGSGPLEGEIKKVARRLKNVVFIGPLSQDSRAEFQHLVELYSAADLFACLPTYNEGFGAVYLEAVACGTPVLSSQRGSLPTFLDQTVAVLIEPKQKEVETAIENLFDKGKKLKRLQASCRSYAVKHFSEKNAEIIFRSYL